MTAQLEAPRVVAASGPVLMTADEARRVIDGIREGLENVRTLLLDLHEREGWRVLGYESFVACAEAEFSASKSQAYRLLDAARLDAILSPIGENGLPEAHLRELKVVADEPEVARSIVSHVRALKGESMTAGDLRDGVDEYVARPPRAKAAKPAAPVRRSVSSRAEAGDNQELPDADATFGDTTDEAFGYSNEAPMEGRRPTPNQRCGLCREHFTGERCPCATAPAPMEGGAFEPDEYPTVSEQPCTACGGEIVVLSEQDDRARGQSINAAIADGRPIVQLCTPCQIGDDARTPDQPGAAEADAVTSSCDSAAVDDGGAPTPAVDAAPPAGPALTLGHPALTPEVSERKYRLGCDSLLTLISLLDPATVVAGLAPEQWPAARDRHATIRTWLNHLDIELVQAEMRLKAAV